MAGALKEKELAQRVYAGLQAASCPLVESLYLREPDAMLRLLCCPSQLRTDVIAWICSSIKPSFANLKAKPARVKDPDVLTKEMASLGQELLLCRDGDLDLIRGDANQLRQLHFLEQLVGLLPGCSKSSDHRAGGETFVNKLFTDDNLPHLAQMLAPTLDPWPASIKGLNTSAKSSSSKPSRAAADVAALLRSTRSVLEQLQSECEFLAAEDPGPAVFSPGILHVAVQDLQQLTATFCRVYETDLRSFCGRDAPSFSQDAGVFQRVYELLLACNTELEVLSEVSAASECVCEEVTQLQTHPRCWSRGSKRTLPDQLEELTRRYADFVSLLHS